MASSAFFNSWRSRLAASVLVGGGFSIAGGLFISDVLHGLGTPLSLAAIAGATAWLLQRRKPKLAGKLPANFEGLLNHCEELLEQFDLLGLPMVSHQIELKQIKELGNRQERHVVLAGAEPKEDLTNILLAAFSGPAPLQLHLAQPLQAAPEDWQWPNLILQADHLVYALAGAPTLADLRWLEALPMAMPVLVLAPPLAPSELDFLRQWRCQLGQGWQLLSREEPLKIEYAPLAQQRASTQCRCLKELIGSWQLLLESERRQQLQPLVQRSQWLVAAAVFASPLPSADLLLLAVVNGLLLKEMAALWRCQWSPDQLQAAATELARTALGLGALEWGSQALAGLLKLNGASWLLGGALQALAAAYFTRVVARSMADYLALAVGVSESDLPSLKAELPLLVANAAAHERLNWNGFGQQASQWLKQQTTTNTIACPTN